MLSTICDSRSVHLGASADEIIRLSDDIRGELVGPLHSVDGICPACRTWLPAITADGAEANDCENCQEDRAALGTDPLNVAVISLYRKPSNLRDWLTRYKGRDEDDDPFDPDCVPIVRAITGRFLLEHGDEFEHLAGGFDMITVVPSTDRQPPHPLESVIASLDIDVPLVRLLERTDAHLGFREPNRHGYRTRPASPSRVLLIDDVYTTGARLNSAAAALTDGGHHVAAALVLARRVNTDYATEAQAMWDTAASTPFDWTDSPWIPTS